MTIESNGGINGFGLPSDQTNLNLDKIAGIEGVKLDDLGDLGDLDDLDDLGGLGELDDDGGNNLDGVNFGGLDGPGGDIQVVSQEVVELVKDLLNDKFYIKSNLEKDVAQSGENIDEGTELGIKRTYVDGSVDFQFRRGVQEEVENALANRRLLEDPGDGSGPVALDPERVTISSMSEEEYQIFYQATYNAFQNLADAANRFQENLEKAKAGLSLVEPSRFKLFKETTSESTEKEDVKKESLQKEQTLKFQREKEDIENKSEATAEKRARERKFLENLELLFINLLISNRNRNSAIGSRSISHISNKRTRSVPNLV